jgi:hypothetical protein
LRQRKSKRRLPVQPINDAFPIQRVFRPFSRCSAVVFNKLFCFGMPALATDGSWYASDGESFYCCSKLNLQMLGKDDAL